MSKQIESAIERGTRAHRFLHAFNRFSKGQYHSKLTWKILSDVWNSLHDGTHNFLMDTGEGKVSPSVMRRLCADAGGQAEAARMLRVEKTAVNRWCSFTHQTNAPWAYAELLQRMIVANECI